MSERKFDMSSYVDVAARITAMKEKYPEATLQSTLTRMDDGWLCKAYAYRTPDDPRPGIGHAFEKAPGSTPYTKDSEAMNAETSAWGRAIVALGFETKHIASAQEVLNRKEGGLGEAPVPKTWTKVREIYDKHGPDGSWELAEAFAVAAMYHLYGSLSSKELTKEQRQVMLQKAAGAAVWLLKDDSNPLGPSFSMEQMKKAWAHVLDGVILEVPDAPKPDAEAENIEELERLAKLAEETITGPPA